MQKFLIVTAAVLGFSFGAVPAFFGQTTHAASSVTTEARQAGSRTLSTQERIRQALASLQRQERNISSEGVTSGNRNNAPGWIKKHRSLVNASGLRSQSSSAKKVPATAPVRSTLSTRDRINQALSTLRGGQPAVSADSSARKPSASPTRKPVASVKPTVKPTPVPSPKASATPKPTTVASAPTSSSKYPWKKGKATLFWVGETAGSANGGITNVESAWDGNWAKSFGGVDSPTKRCGNNPCGFTPKENPFYFALPYNDLGSSGSRKSNAKQIPWYEAKKDRKSVVKNAWIEVSYNGKTTYGQWEDVGPFGEDDFSYVFGNSAVQANSRLEAAGIDLSPAMYHALGMKDNATISWRFVDDKDVPNGPWKDIVTTTDVKW